MDGLCANICLRQERSEKNIDDVLKTGEDSEHGYILEVDLEYPEDLHDLHNDYPLAPESLVVANELFSSYQKDLINKLGSTGGNVSKLVPNLMDKEKYILHYRNLQLYVSLGMKIKQVHKVWSLTNLLGWSRTS